LLAFVTTKLCKYCGEMAHFDHKLSTIKKQCGRQGTQNAGAINGVAV
jgi:hypothetical protein